MASTNPSTAAPVLIIGAGISGLLLAQHFRRNAIPFRIFDRDADFTTRGVGWGLTLHWSLPAIRELLPEDLVERIPTTYVDRKAVEAGEATRFPLFDLSTGELKSATPPATETQRIRVTREKLRQLLAEGVQIEWNKTFRGYEETSDGTVSVSFDDGEKAEGSLVVGSDGGNSRVRKALFPSRHETYRLPVRVMGFKAMFSREEVAALKKLDPFFLQATSSVNDTYMYFSLLDAPGNHEEKQMAGSRSDEEGKYACQIVISWPYRRGFFDSSSGPMEFPPSHEDRVNLIRRFADTWAEPFKTAALGVESVEPRELKPLELNDYAPPKDLRSSGRVVFMGDALHAMTMYRGEGANHAVVDVLDFAAKVTPHLNSDRPSLRAVLDDYEEGVIRRTRPAVLAARRACLDAHDWSRINAQSPLLTKREIFMQYEEEST